MSEWTGERTPNDWSQAPSEWAQAMTDLLGKRVEVTLLNSPPGREVKTVGELRGFSSDSEVFLVGDDGTYQWFWPSLHIRELDS